MADTRNPDAEHPNAVTRAYLRHGLPATMAPQQREAWERYTAGIAVPVRLLPTNGDTCHAPSHGGPYCGRPLLVDGSCIGRADHADNPDDDTNPDDTNPDGTTADPAPGAVSAIDVADHLTWLLGNHNLEIGPLDGATDATRDGTVITVNLHTSSVDRRASGSQRFTLTVAPLTD